MNAAEIRAWTAANLRARRAYYDTLAIEETRAPKTDRQYGMRVGICERCGIDSTKLTRQKCLPCKNYLWRRGNHHTRECPTCGRSHNMPGRVCGACNQRKYREKKRTA